jgi:plasmid stabilization system protein ParE
LKLRWSVRARQDLEAIADFIGRDDPLAARRWIGRLQVRARQAAALPMTGRIVPEWNDPRVREVLVRTYRVISLVQRSAVHVLTVVEGHRRLPPAEELDPT